ncbi:MAG: ACR3 family arsenite efflux transporter [Vicingaceae bacterium]|nr:ACR3 family arsenite efflux transporter [Vicingaceae bacterium]
MVKNKKIGFFEKYLTLWVLICMGVGILVGNIAGTGIHVLSNMNIYDINIPVAVLVWLMIYPMMVQIDFTSVKNAGTKPKALILTVIMNWLVKPFTMAFFAWIFFDYLYQAFINPDDAKEYISGAILLGAAPCTAMVFVWSYLTNGDPAYTLIQVSVNDLIILIAFIPIVGLLLGVTNVEVPYYTLFTSIVTFVVIPLFAGVVTRIWLIKSKGKEWFSTVFLKNLKPVSIIALLTTLILLFAFKGQSIINDPVLVFLIAVPLVIQTYFIFFITWGFGRLIKLPHSKCSPAAMIGASNFFELAVAVAIALFGIDSGAALVTVVGVLIEVPIMLSLVRFSNKFKF